MAGIFLFAGTVSAASYTLFGDAAIVTGGNPNNAVQLHSSWTHGDWSSITYGGIDFTIPAGATLGNLNTLSADYKIIAGDCGGGAPRFVLNYDNNPNTNIVVYVGPLPNYTGCVLNSWQNTSNLIGSVDLRFDTTQLGGTFYDSYSNAVTLSSTHTVTGISFVVDGGWAVSGDNQTVLVDNVVVNTDIYTFDPEVKKVNVCHLEKKNSDKYHLINVSLNALQAHLNHGDAILGDWRLNPAELTVNVTYGSSWLYTATFARNGTVLTGSLTDSYAPITGPIVNGSINGDHVVFSFDYGSGSLQGMRTYDGTIQTDGDLVGKWSQTGSQSTGQLFDFVIANFYSQVTCE